MNEKKRAPGWRKALKNMTDNVVVRYYIVRCKIHDCPAWDQVEAHGIPKRDAVPQFMENEGWTYDKDGNWTCWDCTKEGE